MSALSVEIESILNQSLAAPVRIAVATTVLEPASLTAEEQVQFAQLAGSARDKSWLLGRAALKNLLLKIERNLNTSEIAFPNKEFSLSHSGDFAIALFSDAKFVSGVGVDVECVRIVKPGTARFFLVQEERDYIRTVPESQCSAELLRLWTMKESLFKADIHNSGRGLKNYFVHDPKLHSGKASIRDEKTELVYSSLQLGSLVISAALSMVN